MAMDNPFKKKFSDEYVKELEKFITELVMVDYYTYQQMKAEWWCKGDSQKIIDFFQLPHTALHDKYNEWCKPAREKQIKDTENEIIAEMSKKKSKFVEENNVDPTEAKYQVVKQFTTSFKLWDNFEERITIWIPYYATQSQKYKFWWTINVSKLKTPNFYNEALKNFKRFDVNQDIYISLEK